MGAVVCEELEEERGHQKTGSDNTTSSNSTQCLDADMEGEAASVATATSRSSQGVAYPGWTVAMPSSPHILDPAASVSRVSILPRVDLVTTQL